MNTHPSKLSDISFELAERTKCPLFKRSLTKGCIKIVFFSFFELSLFEVVLKVTSIISIYGQNLFRKRHILRRWGKVYSRFIVFNKLINKCIKKWSVYLRQMIVIHSEVYLRHIECSREWWSLGVVLAQLQVEASIKWAQPVIAPEQHVSAVLARCVVNWNSNAIFKTIPFKRNDNKKKYTK